MRARWKRKRSAGSRIETETVAPPDAEHRDEGHERQAEIVNADYLQPDNRQQTERRNDDRVRSAGVPADDERGKPDNKRRVHEATRPPVASQRVSPSRTRERAVTDLEFVRNRSLEEQPGAQYCHDERTSEHHSVDTERCRADRRDSAEHQDLCALNCAAGRTALCRRCERASGRWYYRRARPFQFGGN